MWLAEKRGKRGEMRLVWFFVAVAGLVLVSLGGVFVQGYYGQVGRAYEFVFDGFSVNAFLKGYFGEAFYEKGSFDGEFNDDKFRNRKFYINECSSDINKMFSLDEQKISFKGENL